MTDYESEQMLNEYLLFHYGSPEQVLPWEEGPRGALGFPRRCAERALEGAGLGPESRALDLGCAVGGSSFVLSATVGEVVGIDYSQAFIETAKRLASGEAVSYPLKRVGDWVEQAVARAPDDARPDRVRFEVGDAHELDPELGSFDLVLACNLLCRLHHPGRLLARLATLVRPGGRLFLTTPHTWLEAFTAKAEWLGGRAPGDDPLAGLEAALAPAFSLVRRTDLPFLIREHARKYQWSVAEATVWHRHASATDGS